MTIQEKRAERERVWRERIAGQQRSGQTIRAFCQEQGVSAPQFYYWRQRLARAAEPVRFALVDRGSPRGAAGIEVTLTGGEQLRIAAGADAATLRMVLGVLRETRA